MKNQSELDFESEDMQRMVERFARAKWITGTNVVTPDDFLFTFSPLGHARMRVLAGLLKRIAPAVFKAPVEKFSRWTQLKLHLRFFGKLAAFGAELKPWKWSGGEKGAFLALIAGYAMNHPSVTGENHK